MYDSDLCASSESLRDDDFEAIYHLTGALDRLSRFRFPLKTNDVTRAYFEQIAKIETGPIHDDMLKIVQGSAEAMQRVADALPTWNFMLRITCADESRADAHRQLITDTLWPGVPVVPMMVPGATDARFLRAAGRSTVPLTWHLLKPHQAFHAIGRADACIVLACARRMPTITIRNVPATIVRSLKTLARRRHRSMEQEVRDLLEMYVSERRSVLDQIEAAWGSQTRRPTAREVNAWISAGR